MTLTPEQEKDRDAALNRSPAEVAALVGTSQRKIYTALSIPQITGECWSREIYTPPASEWLAIQHILGIYDHPAARPETDLTTEDRETALARTPREIAAACSCTLKQLSESLFVEYGTIVEWSGGRQKPTPHLYLALQAVLGLYRHPAAKLKSTPTH